ncbi:MAG: TlpA disulfide reductase family protein [Bdellovibrionota bacterium]
MQLRYITVFLAVSISFLITIGCVRENSIRSRQAVIFELKDKDGKSHSLSDQREKSVLLHFWASWCEPCIEEIKSIVEFSEAYKGFPLVVIAVSVDEKWENALKIIPKKTLPSNTIWLLDPTGTLPKKYGTFRFPETFLLSSKLEIVEKFIGPQDWQGARARFTVEQALLGPGK